MLTCILQLGGIAIIGENKTMVPCVQKDITKKFVVLADYGGRY